MEHTINLASEAFINAICPASSQYKNSKQKMTVRKGVDSDEEHSEDNESNSELEWLANLAYGSLVDGGNQ